LENIEEEQNNSNLMAVDEEHYGMTPKHTDELADEVDYGDV
jgi:hypothetical protein